MPTENSDEENEKNKLTLAAIFIATYTALLFSIPQILPASPTTLLKEIIYIVFVGCGGLIDTIFFLYAAFYALELNSTKTTILTFFKIHLQPNEIKNIRRWLFAIGIDLVFTSFTMPILILVQKIQPFFSRMISGWPGVLIGFIMAVTFFGLVGVILRFIFKHLGKD